MTWLKHATRGFVVPEFIMCILWLVFGVYIGLHRPVEKRHDKPVVAGYIMATVTIPLFDYVRQRLTDGGQPTVAAQWILLFMFIGASVILAWLLSFVTWAATALASAVVVGYSIYFLGAPTLTSGVIWVAYCIPAGIIIFKYRENLNTACGYFVVSLCCSIGVFYSIVYLSVDGFSALVDDFVECLHEDESSTVRRCSVSQYVIFGTAIVRFFLIGALGFHQWAHARHVREALDRMAERELVKQDLDVIADQE